MNSPIKFGTDGWRAIIAEDFTFDNVRICAQAVAGYLQESGLAGRGLVIGYDTRFASEDFAAAAAEVVAGNGIKVYLCPRPTPTPVVSYAVLDRKAGGAVVITASHNPARWNGFKFKDEHGSSASPETTADIERRIAGILAGQEIKRLHLAVARQQGLVQDYDPEPAFFQQMGRLVDLDALRRARFKVVIDPMFGAGAGYLKKALGGGSLEITEINAERNPLFPGIQPEPIAANLTRLSATVRETGASVGLATDGDADRMGIVDENGRFLTQLQVFALLCLYLLEVRGERGALVKSLTTTSMIFRLGEIFNVPVHETAVGFKYIAPIMLAENALIGGEESGGYGFRGHLAERDGIVGNLYFLDLMAKTGKTPSQLIDYLYSKVGPHHYQRVDLHFDESQRKAVIARVQDAPQSIEGVKVLKLDTTDGFRLILADGSWLLIRFSGTEPVIRIYSETDSPERATRLLEAGRKLAGV
ncbi:MAG: phosphoglucomutase/phosphomannomutase family protein [Chloroflexi bacterium]|nr:phosphoglucomutase/phosphomannomutase family protein [Chloroflexota bacterium]